MIKTLIYSCVFFNEKYINLLTLLLKSYKLFGNESNNINYLILCSPNFKDKIQLIFDNLKLKGKIWCLNLKTKFEAACSRLKIFDYPEVDFYDKILYLDCDILITNSINKVLDIQLENKLYVLQEKCHRLYHCVKFNNKEYNLLDKNSTFTSGIILFYNNKIIKNLFSEILLDINNHINSKLPIPDCFDQPFIIYRAIKKNLYNNKDLINLAINNPNNYNGETICHFPSTPGHFESHFVKMTNFMNNIIFNLNKNSNEIIPEIIPNDFINKVLKKNINIYDDIWTCSNEFREDIKHFFKDNSNYKIAEIGSHKGYTTRYLSNIFQKVYAVDNSIEWTNFNKNLNKDKNNIEYIHLDIYANSWNIIPDVDVVFIDAGHTYECCKSDLYNSIKSFNGLKYIIFDDYGVWPGVKQVVNECLTCQILIFEKYIGLNDVPGPGNKVIKNTTEGIVCSVNPASIHLINKTYIWENSNIEFLENGKMNAFGAGNYSFIDKYLVKCDFGGREHLLKFNQDYSTFISVRKGDFEVISGHKYRKK